MLGALAGDMIGSIYEARPIKTTNFPLFVAQSTFTDDTVLTVAVADAILNDRDYGTALKAWGRRYPNAGYGGSFMQWLHAADSQPYNSWGNGSAMRVSPVGWAYDRRETVLSEAERSAAVTHNHPEGIKGAQATALAIYLARTGQPKDKIRAEIEQHFSYDLSSTLAELRPTYRFDVSCQGTVPAALLAFLESNDVESAIRLAISLGGDSDTLACIAGSIAHAFYRDIPPNIEAEVRQRLPEEMVAVVDTFTARYGD
jgi:ADP-ribosylglycohydrolase